MCKRSLLYTDVNEVSRAGTAVLFRLYQEVWSNAVVVAPWFGPLVRAKPDQLSDLLSNMHAHIVSECQAQWACFCLGASSAIHCERRALLCAAQQGMVASCRAVDLHSSDLLILWRHACQHHDGHYAARDMCRFLHWSPGCPGV